jgi:rhodanese-related sulfurtransferase
VTKARLFLWKRPVTLIDIREPDEAGRTGAIPGAMPSRSAPATEAALAASTSASILALGHRDPQPAEEEEAGGMSRTTRLTMCRSGALSLTRRSLPEGPSGAPGMCLRHARRPGRLPPGG